MSNKYLRLIPYLKCDIDFGLPLVAVLGLIYSIWAGDFFWRAMCVSPYSRDDYFMTGTIQKTHYILAFSTVFLLYFGVKDQKTKYIRLWHHLKILESVAIFIQSLVFILIDTAYSGHSDHWPYSIFSIFLLGFGHYLIICVKQSFNEIPNEEADPIPSEVKSKLSNLDLNEKPPSYNELTDEKNQTKISIDSNVMPAVHN